jgi:8-oxo-dGTP diphosphatase
MEKIVVGLIQNQDTFLIARRNVSSENITWSFPGGAIENNETEEDAVIREIFEEINITVDVIKKFGQRIHPITNKEMSYLLCVYKSGEVIIKDCDELSEVKWVNAKELFELIKGDIFQPLKNYLADYLD